MTTILMGLLQASLSGDANDVNDLHSCLLSTAPFKLESIEVDGGSEFRAHFEQSCSQSGIELFVLPPKSPELNGCVERCNRTLRYEFYRLYDGLFEFQELKKSLGDTMKIYNDFRPHQTLNQDMPLQYYGRNFSEAALLS